MVSPARHDLPRLMLLDMPLIVRFHGWSCVGRTSRDFSSQPLLPLVHVCTKRSRALELSGSSEYQTRRHTPKAPQRSPVFVSNAPCPVWSLSLRLVVIPAESRHWTYTTGWGHVSTNLPHGEPRDLLAHRLPHPIAALVSSCRFYFFTLFFPSSFGQSLIPFCTPNIAPLGHNFTHVSEAQLHEPIDCCFEPEKQLPAATSFCQSW
jgi:hypothetical protein